MATFWGEVCKYTAGALTFPIAVGKATYDALNTNKTFSEAFTDAEIDLIDDAMDGAQKFGEENGHKLAHGAARIVEHMIKKGR